MKYQVTILPILLLFIVQMGNAQTTESLHKFYIPLLFGSGYGYELSVSDAMTLNASIDMRTYIGEDNLALDNIVFSPRISLEPRYYYNLKRKAARGENTESNAASYVSLNMSYELPIGYSAIRDEPQNTIRILPTWGFRKELTPHFSLDFGLFAGYKLLKDGVRLYYPDDQIEVEPWSTHKFSYGFNIILNHIF